MKEILARVLHHKDRYVWPFLRDERQNGVVEVRVYDNQLRLGHAHELLHLLERVVYLPVKEYLLRRKLLVLHRVENQLEAFLVAGLRVFLFQLTAFRGFDTRQQRRKRGKRATHRNEHIHYANAHGNSGFAFEHG